MGLKRSPMVDSCLNCVAASKDTLKLKVYIPAITLPITIIVIIQTSFARRSLFSLCVSATVCLFLEGWLTIFLTRANHDPDADSSNIWVPLSPGLSPTNSGKEEGVDEITCT